MGKRPSQTQNHSASQNERRPLYNEDAERGVLGCVLLDSNKVLDFCIEKQIEPESFYIPAHQTVFETMKNMALEGRPVDLLTLSDRLRAAGKLDEVGGVIFLDQLLNSIPTAAHAEYYIDIVRQNHLLRRILDSARNAETECYNSEESADTILGKVEQSFFDITEQRHSSMRPWAEVVKTTMVTIDHILDTKKGLSGLSTGYIDLDNKLMGLHKGDLIILAARPSMGKTSLAMNIAEHVALGKTDGQPKPVGIFSLEMSQEQLVMRMLCSHAKVSSHKLAGGYLNQASHGALTQAAAILTKAPIYLDDTAGLDILELRARARRMKKKYGIELFIIDYLQLLHSKDNHRDGRQQEIASISGSIKAMAKELKIPALVLSQLNRASETRDRSGKPRLADLRESGAIEQDADVVCMLRRPSRYEDKDDENEPEDAGLAILDIAKQRNGPVGEIKLFFDEEITRFENYTEDKFYDGPQADDE